MSMDCMDDSNGFEDPLQWHTRPRWTVAQFVAQLVQRLLQFEQPEQSLARDERAVQRGAPRLGVIGRQERLAYLPRPGAGQGCELGEFDLVVRGAAQRAVLHVAE